MALHDYVFARCEDIHRSGARVAKLETEDLAGGLVQVDALLLLGRSEDAFLQVWELLEVRSDGSVHRVQYSYHLSARDQFLFRYDRDPDNHPEMPDHKHLALDRRIAGTVRFRDILDEAFAVIAELEAPDGDA